MSTPEPILRVENLVKHFEVGGGLFGGRPAVVKAVDGVSFEIGRGETLGLVGESGCGKTTTGRCILRLEPPTGGRVIFEGRDLSTLSDGEMRGMRRRMQVIFQDPYSSLNPRMTVGQIIAEPLAVHRIVPDRAARAARVQDLLRHAGLLPAMARRYPHELSGGQAQRVAIALAVALRAEVLIADEPTSALDVTVQAEILEVLQTLRAEESLAAIFISHDLAVVSGICDSVAIMYGGKVVERGPVGRTLRHPEHPYTRELLAAVPRLSRPEEPGA
jgi:peptide/nickel transport system ATP-binding protein